MRLTQPESERNRKQILEAAGRLFREHGFDGVGVDGLMKGAGFTHGGFYNHFASKEELEAEASAAGIAQKNAEIVEWLSDPSTDAWKRYVHYYLCAKHRGDRAGGCMLGACHSGVTGGASRPLPEREQERPRLSATRLRRPRPKWP
jgi:TetR/AcrR family transcriptional repressor of nem operon